MSFSYIQSEPELWTVGSYYDDRWVPESDHGSPEEAAQRVAWLNGAGGESTVPAEDAAPATFGEWCILELMGHRRLAGHVREVQLAGAGFLRLDIPAVGDDPERTQFISPSSVYALHPVNEDTARRAAGAWRPAPVHRWELPAAPVDRDGRDDDDAVDRLSPPGPDPGWEVPPGADPDLDDEDPVDGVTERYAAAGRPDDESPF